jgi:hypothetical protein
MDLIILDTRNYDRSITSLGTPPFHSVSKHELTFNRLER